MTPTECKTVLEDNLSESIHFATDLRHVLDEEREALQRRDTVALTDTAARKQSYVIKLDELDGKRKEFCRACGFEDSIDSVPQMVEWCDDQAEVRASWEQFLNVAETCSLKNSSNGAIIRVRQAQIKDAIGLLRNGTKESNTYGPKGQDDDGPQARSLAEA